jgi:hypothetical protein
MSLQPQVDVHAGGTQYAPFSGGDANGGNNLAPFFGLPTRSDRLLRPDDRLPHEAINLSDGQDFADLYTGPSPFMTVTIEALIVGGNEWPTKRLLPWVVRPRAAPFKNANASYSTRTRSTSAGAFGGAYP